jgi:hypothetical protein
MTTFRRITRTVTVSLIAVAGIAALATDASACGGDWAPAMMDPKIDHRPQAVAQAEKQMSDGKAIAAAASVIRSMPHVRSLNAKKSTLVARAQRTLAVALARNGGSLDIKKEVPDYARGTWQGKTAEERQANLEWAVSTLRTVAETKKDDPAVKTEMAEAMAQLDTQRSEARTVLEELAKKDLIASPEGYAALAKLRSQAGDAQGEKLALERCQAMSGGAAGVCGAAVAAKS